MFLSQQALVNFNETTITDFWIGANDLEFPGRWAWLDETIFEFKDWDKGQPQNISGTNCAAAIMKYEKWVADDCYTQKSYVYWEYFDQTGFCYKLFQNSSTDHLTFWGAENKCQKFGGHLASIHSYGEALLVGSMGPIRYANIYIGLFTDNIGKTWNWTDGTPFDYPNWITNEPENIYHNKCGAIFDKFETYTGGYCTYKCDSTLFFACKRLPS
uniref:C-type lectin domain-containing protein n=1 Tax=Panagrolaimus sp. PS1159 TaxID=55785 RepID=A0AC35GDC2_9BILA